MRTRPATIATVVIALGLALTTIGLARGLPFTFAGHGDRATIAADLWAHGTALSPALVALVFVGLLAAIAIRPTPGGRRAAIWLGVLAVALSVASLAEPAVQQALLLGTVDVVTPLEWAFQVGLIALVLTCVGEARLARVGTLSVDEGPARSGGEPVAAGRAKSTPSLAGAGA